MSQPKNPKGIFFLLIYALLLNKTRHHHIEKIINRQRRLAHEALPRLHGKAPQKRTNIRQCQNNNDSNQGDTTTPCTAFLCRNVTFSGLVKDTLCLRNTAPKWAPRHDR